MRIILSAYLTAMALMSVLAFSVFGYDKRCAQHDRRRVSEKALLLLCTFFGAPGGMAGMRVWRHKTRKAPFPFVVPLLCIIQGAMVLGLASFC